VPPPADPRSDRGLDLAPLLEKLRRAEFRVDTRQFLSAVDLLLACARQGAPLGRDPDRLRDHLAPIFCTSPEEQARFGEVLNAWLAEDGRGAVTDDSSTSSAQPDAATTDAHPGTGRTGASDTDGSAGAGRPRGRLARWIVPLAGALAVAVVLSAVAMYRYAPHTVEGTVRRRLGSWSEPAADARVQVEDQVLTADRQGFFQLRLARADGVRVVTASMDGWLPGSAGASVTGGLVEIVLEPIPPAPPPPPEARPDAGGLRITRLGSMRPQAAPARVVERQVAWRPAIAGALGCALAVLAAWLLVARLRRRLVLQRLPAQGRPDFASLQTGPSAEPLFDPTRLRRTAAALRRPSVQPVRQLDVLRSVEAGARQAGLTVAVYGSRRAMPEYVALIERCAAEDHQARLTDELLAQLRELGVAVERYFYSGDPRTCVPQAGGRGMRLADVLARHHRATLLLFAPASRLFSPVSGRLQPWVDPLRSLPRRALLTAEPAYHWTGLETALAEQGFGVLEAHEGGLLSFAELDDDWNINRAFPARYARPYPALLLDRPDLPFQRETPPDPLLARLVRELKGYLGPRGFLWLAACAVYPEVDWPLTLHLSKSIWPPAERPAELRPHLIALARLPWFRHGFIPDWLRTTLIALLPHNQETEVRRSLAQRLQALAESFSSARPAPAGGLMRIAAWLGRPLDVARTAPPGTPLRDPVFLGYMAATRIAAPVVEAPSALRKLFRHVRALPRVRAVQRAARTWRQRLPEVVRGLLFHRPALTGGVLSVVVGGLSLAALVPMNRQMIERLLPTRPLKIAVAPDGSSVVTASADRIELWRPDGTSRGGIDQQNPIEVAFRLDGSFVAANATTNGRQVLEVWNQETVDVAGIKAQSSQNIDFLTDTSPVVAVRVGPLAAGEAKPVVSVKADGSLTIRDDGRSGTISARTAVTTSEGIDLSGDGTTVAVADLEGQTQVMNLNAEIGRRSWVPLGDRSVAVRLSWDGRRVATVSSEGRLLMRDVGTNAVVTMIGPPSQSDARGVVRVSLSRDARMALLISRTADPNTEDATLWDSSGNQLTEIQRGRAPLSGALSLDGRLAAVASDGLVTTYTIDRPGQSTPPVQQSAAGSSPPDAGTVPATTSPGSQPAQRPRSPDQRDPSQRASTSRGGRRDASTDTRGASTPSIPPVAGITPDAGAAGNEPPFGRTDPNAPPNVPTAPPATPDAAPDTAPPATQPPEPARSTLHVLAVGISDYEDTRLRLKRPSYDARTLAAQLNRRSRGLFTAARVRVLDDRNATRRALTSELEALAKSTQPEDVVVFYFEGQAMRQGGQISILLADAILPERARNLRRNSEGTPTPLSTAVPGGNDPASGAFSVVELTDALARLQATRVLVLFDVYTGAAEAVDNANQAGPDLRRGFGASRPGYVFLGVEEESGLTKGEGGNFPSLLLSGLTGNADRNADGDVDVAELVRFLADRPPRGIVEYLQYPESIEAIERNNFPLARAAPPATAK
jgi:hypothetical protein